MLVLGGRCGNRNQTKSGGRYCLLQNWYKYNTNTLEIQYKYVRNTIQIQKKCSTNTKQRAGQVLLAAASHRYIVVDLCTFILYVFVIYRRFPFINYIVLYIFCHICI